MLSPSVSALRAASCCTNAGVKDLADALEVRAHDGMNRPERGLVGGAEPHVPLQLVKQCLGHGPSFVQVPQRRNREQRCRGWRALSVNSLV